MRKAFFLSVIMVLSTSVCQGTIFDENDRYDRIMREERKPPKAEEKKDPLIFMLSQKFDMNEKDLNKLRNKGYGYTEIIKVIIISRDANVKLEDVVHKRDKKVLFKKIIEEYRLDGEKIEDEANLARREIDEYTIKIVTDTIKGTTSQVLR